VQHAMIIIELFPYLIYLLIAIWLGWGIVSFVKAPPLGKRFAIIGGLGLAGSFSLFYLFGLDLFAYMIQGAVYLYGYIGNPWMSIPLLVLAWCVAIVLFAAAFGLPLIVASRYAPIKRGNIWYRDRNEWKNKLSGSGENE